MSLTRKCDYCEQTIKDDASDTSGGDDFFYSISKYYLDHSKGSAGTIDIHRTCIRGFAAEMLTEVSG